MAHGLARLLLEEGLQPGKDGLPSEQELVRRLLRILSVGMTAAPVE